MIIVLQTFPRPRLSNTKYVRKSLSFPSPTYNSHKALIPQRGKENIKEYWPLVGLGVRISNIKDNLTCEHVWQTYSNLPACISYCECYFSTTYYNIIRGKIASHLYLSPSVQQYFLKTFIFCSVPTSHVFYKGGRLSDYIIGSEGCGWRERNIPWLTLLFAEQGQWTDSVRAGLQTAQPAGDWLLRAGVHQQQGSHGRVLVPSLHQQLGEFVSKI